MPVDTHDWLDFLKYSGGRNQHCAKPAIQPVSHSHIWTHYGVSSSSRGVGKVVPSITSSTGLVPFSLCLSLSLYKNCCNIGRCCRSAFSRIVLRFTHAIACCYRGVGRRRALCHCWRQRCVGRSGGVRGWKQVPVARSSSSEGPAPRRSLGHWLHLRTSYGDRRTSWWSPTAPASRSSSRH